MNLSLRLDHCVTAISDWERSNRFYADVLGVELIDLSVYFRDPDGSLLEPISYAS